MCFAEFSLIHGIRLWTAASRILAFLDRSPSMAGSRKFALRGFLLSPGIPEEAFI